MAEKKIVDLVINDNLNETESNLQSLSGQINSSNKDVQKLSDSFEELNSTTHDVGASFEEVYGDLKPLTARMGEAEDRLYELSLAGKQGTAEFQALLETVGNYRRVQIETDLAVDSAATTMSQKLGGSLEYVAGAFAVTQGALGAFGIENETVEKSILKVQSALAITQGFTAMREGANSVKQLGTAIKGLTIFQTAYNFVNNATSVGLKVLRGALLATGIGALVVGVGLLIANFDKVKKAVLNLFPGLTTVASYVGKLTNQITDFVGATSKATRKLDDLKAAADRTLATNKKFIQEHGDQIDEFTRQKLDAKNEYAEALKEDGVNTVALAKKLNRQLAKIDADRNKADATKAKEAQDAKNQKAKEAGDAAKQKREEEKREKEAYDKSILDAIQKYNDELLDIEADTERKRLELWYTRQQAEVIALAKNETDKQKLLTALKADYTKKSNDLQAKESDEAIKILQENLDKEMWAEFDAFDKKLKKRTDKDLEDAKNTELTFDQRLIALANRESQLKNIYFESEDAKTEYLKQNAEIRKTIEKEQADEAIKKEKLVLDAKKQLLMQSASILGEYSNILGQQTAEGKALAVAQATINAYLGISEVWKAPNPYPEPWGTATKIASTVLLGTSAFQNVQKILAVDVPGAGGGGGSAPSMPTASAPSFNVVGTSGANQLAQTIGQQSQTPVKAYVVSQDVTTQQALDRNIVKSASLG